MMEKPAFQPTIVSRAFQGYCTDRNIFGFSESGDVLPAVVVLIFCTSNDRLDNGTNFAMTGIRSRTLPPFRMVRWKLRGQPFRYRVS